MNVLESLDFCLKETSKMHPNINLGDNLYAYLTGKIKSNAFTRNNGARECIEGLSLNRIYIEVINQVIKIGILYDYYKKKNNPIADELPYGKDCSSYVKAIRDGQNYYTYLTSNQDFFEKMVKCFADARYLNNGKHAFLTSNITLYGTQKIIEQDVNNGLKFKNIRINTETVNKCKQDILSGNQIKNHHNEYALDGNMYAINDVGKKRTNQEDSVLILTHPSNKDFKLLVVSDGMGGHMNGELASGYVVTEMMKWFESLDVSLFEREQELRNLFKEEIIKISKDFYSTYCYKYGRLTPGATFTGAIVGKNKTIVGNVGDSRTYISKNGDLSQVTTDDSLVQILYQSGEIKNKDDMRFHVDSNKVTQHMGQGIMISPDTIFLNNNDYDLLMLFSDGITDCLSDNNIKIITKSTPRDLLAKTIIEKAKVTNSVRNDLGEQYYNRIEGGKDNESVAIYSRGM